MGGSAKVLVWGLLVLGVAGCAGPEPVREAIEPAPPARDLLAELRLLAAEQGDVIEVQPLRDPGVEDLLQHAAQAIEQGRFKRAERALRRAIELSPEDPDLMQQRAEVLLVQRRLDEAEQLASLSFERGPKLGPLCRRNWATVRLAREERGDPIGAQTAGQQMARCLVEPPVRM